MFLHYLLGFILTLVCYVISLSVIFMFVIIFKRTRKMADFSSLSCDCLCSVVHPNGALSWFSVCDCGIS